MSFWAAFLPFLAHCSISRKNRLQIFTASALQFCSITDQQSQGSCFYLAGKCQPKNLEKVPLCYGHLPMSINQETGIFPPSHCRCQMAPSLEKLGIIWKNRERSRKIWKTTFILAFKTKILTKIELKRCRNAIVNQPKWTKNVLINGKYTKSEWNKE